MRYLYSTSDMFAIANVKAKKLIQNLPKGVIMCASTIMYQRRHNVPLGIIIHRKVSLITALPCISSMREHCILSRKACISSKRSFVYHHCTAMYYIGSAPPHRGNLNHKLK